MAEIERQYIQHLRTSGYTAPVESEDLIVHPGEIAVATDNAFPKLFIKKNDGTFEEFPGISRILNAELAIEKALSDLDIRLNLLASKVGKGIYGTTITDYILENIPQN